MLKHYKDKNKKLPESRKLQLDLKGTKLYVNNIMEKNLLQPPAPLELFPDQDEQKEMNKLKFVYSPPQEEKGSSFWAAACKTANINEVRKAYCKVKQESPTTDHIMAACNIPYDGDSLYEYANDGKHGGGFKIQSILEQENITNTVVFMFRKYGGEQIGYRHFEMIQVLEQHKLHLAQND